MDEGERHKGVLPDLWDRDHNLLKKAKEYGCTVAELVKWIETGKRSEKEKEKENADM